MKNLARIILTAALVFSTGAGAVAQEKKALTVTDMMKFRHIKSPAISSDGKWVIHTSSPDRGDPEVFVYSTDGKKKYTIPLGEKPVISNDGDWVVAVRSVPAEEALKPGAAKGKDKPKAGMSLLNTSTGELAVFENIQSFSISNDSKWLIYHEAEAGKSGGAKGGNGSEKGKGMDRKPGTDLHVLSLNDQSDHKIAFVTKYSVDSTSRYLALVLADTAGSSDGVFLAELSGAAPMPAPLYADSNAWGDYLTWNNRSNQLAFLAGKKDKKQKPGDAQVYLWSPGESSAKVILSDRDLPEGHKVYHKNSLRFSLDGQRLFLGIKPESEIIKPEDDKRDTIAPVFDTDGILADRTLDVWHWNDPYINSNQKKRWGRVKDQTYTGVYHLEAGRFVQLADPDMPELRITDCPAKLLGYSNVPYAKRVTWDGQIMDVYVVDLETGERQLALQEQEHSVSLSPDGNYLVYYHGGNWYLMETATLETVKKGSASPASTPPGSCPNNSRNLTKKLEVPFADEDWDYPADVPGYGVAGWTEGSKSVLIYDKFDIWEFPSAGGDPVCLTEGVGRKEKLQFRIRRIDQPGASSRSGRSGIQPLRKGEEVFLSAYHDLKKHTAVYSLEIGRAGVTKLAEEPKNFTLIARAADSDKILYSRESYTEYPDLWVTDEDFKKPKKLSDANPRISEFAWGEAELVEWSSADGKPIQGILIKPGNYKPGEKYPVLVYYYRFFTNRLYDFNEVVVNHRPCFPFYASNGYAVFLPDIRFDIGNPGYSATKCLVPGVQKIIDMGVADSDAVCLHGHSWSGYQTAFVVTQTDMFACAIAGAPVSNMTSAYSGIRWGTGLARQFQYEKSQSRIGANLWEARDKYIENSPVFFADRINTPLLIQFGDQDEAVPWYQGIELYLAMRRLEKDCVFLQYRNEPHHLKQYANKLDYTLKFKAYLDHYLKGEPAPDWLKTGIPYQGK